MYSTTRVNTTEDEKWLARTGSPNFVSEIASFWLAIAAKLCRREGVIDINISAQARDLLGRQRIRRGHSPRPCHLVFFRSMPPAEERASVANGLSAFRALFCENGFRDGGGSGADGAETELWIDVVVVVGVVGRAGG